MQVTAGKIQETAVFSAALRQLVPIKVDVSAQHLVGNGPKRVMMAKGKKTAE